MKRILLFLTFIYIIYPSTTYASELYVFWSNDGTIVILKNQTYEINFDEKIDIYGIKHRDQANRSRFSVYDENGNKIYEQSDEIADNDTTIVNTNILNAKKIIFKNNNTVMSAYIQEFKIYSKPIDGPPSEISNIETTADHESISYTFDLPTDTDFSHVNVYKDGSVIGTTTDGTYTMEGLEPETEYTLVFKTFDTNGNESEGVAVIETTEPEPTEPEPTELPPSEISNIETTAGHESISYTFDLPTDSDFSHVNIYENGAVIGTTTDGTYTMTGLEPETEYTLVFKSVDTNGNESEGITVTETTEPEPIEGSESTQNEAGDYTISWSSPTTGEMKILIGGQEYATVPASDLSITIPKNDMEFDMFGEPDYEIVHIKEDGTEGSTTKPDLTDKLGNVNAINLLTMIAAILAMLGQFVLLGLAIHYAPQLIRLVKEAAK